MKEIITFISKELKIIFGNYHGLFVDNVDEVMHKAIHAGAIEINPAKDHDYGYRQGMFKDPFGHYWQIQKKIF